MDRVVLRQLPGQVLAALRSRRQDVGVAKIFGSDVYDSKGGESDGIIADFLRATGIGGMTEARSADTKVCSADAHQSSEGPDYCVEGMEFCGKGGVYDSAGDDGTIAGQICSDEGGEVHVSEGRFDDTTGKVYSNEDSMDDIGGFEAPLAERGGGEVGHERFIQESFADCDLGVGVGGMDYDGMGSTGGGNSITNNIGAETFSTGDGGAEDEYSDEEIRERGKEWTAGWIGAFGQGDVELQGGAELQGSMELVGVFIDGGVELQDVLVQGGVELQGGGADDLQECVRKIVRGGARLELPGRPFVFLPGGRVRRVCYVLCDESGHIENNGQQCLGWREHAGIRQRVA